MGTLPNSVNFDTDIQYVSQPCLTWIIDGDHISGQDDGLDAMRQAVEHILLTERYAFQIYTSDYGTETEDLIGEERDYVESELVRRVTEALTADDRVTGISDISFTFEGDTLYMSFSVETVIGAFTEAIGI